MTDQVPQHITTIKVITFPANSNIYINRIPKH